MTTAMTIEALRGKDRPAGLAGPLLALWLDGQGDWDGAHVAINTAGDKSSCWVHAYLHRREGDLANADYWYHRAGQTRPSGPLDAEWTEIALALLGR